MPSDLAHHARENSLDWDGTLSKAAAVTGKTARVLEERRRLISMTSAFLAPL